MAYTVPYVATFRCDKGHEFEAAASPSENDAEAICPRCYEEWIIANMPRGRQVSEAVLQKPGLVKLSADAEYWSPPHGSEPTAAFMCDDEGIAWR